MIQRHGAARDSSTHGNGIDRYDFHSFRAVRAGLRPTGYLVIWSAAETPALAAALRGVFDEVRISCEPVRLQGRNEHHWLYMGTAASLEPGGRRDIRS